MSRNVINLSRYRRQRTKQLMASVAQTLAENDYRLEDIIEQVTGRALVLLELAHKLPEGSDAQMATEMAAQVWLDMACVATGGDPVGERRATAERIFGAGNRQ